MKTLIKYFMLTTLIIFGLTFIVLFYVENSKIQTSKAWLELEEEKVIKAEIKLIDEEVAIIISDLKYLKLRLQSVMNNSNEYNQLIEEWIIFASSKEKYDQIRFIDSNGYEKIRVNYNAGNPASVSQKELQFKGDHYYFNDSINLSEGQLYISPLDLNIENGQVELPRKPMIRLAMPLIIDGQTQGIVIVNYLAQDFLDKFQSAFDDSKGTLYLVNEDGYYLSSRDNKKDFAFMFESNKTLSFSSEYPEIWTRIRMKGGKIVSKQGLFTAVKLNFNEKILETAKEQVLFKEDEWYIISHILSNNKNYYYVQPQGFQIINEIIKNHRLLLLLLTLLTFIITALVYQNTKSFRQIRYLSEYDSMTGVLNRRAGFNSLKELLRTYDERSGRMFLCYLDVDGLKQVNDNLGHAYGDELLMLVVSVVRCVIRDSDLFIRLGGDEFLLVLHHMDKDVHQIIWRRIQNELNVINRSKKYKYIIRVSKGFVEITKGGPKDISILMKLADEQMYIDKESHRGSVLKE